MSKKRTFLASDKSAFKRFLLIYIMDLQGLYTHQTSSTIPKTNTCNKKLMVAREDSFVKYVLYMPFFFSSDGHKPMIFSFIMAV